MITDEERREVAARLRGLDAKITSRNTLEQAVDKFMKAVCGDIPFSPIRYSVRNLCGLANMLADLIEPEPERTCHPVIEDEIEVCSNCGYDIDGYGWSYCPNYGARVVE